MEYAPPPTARWLTVDDGLVLWDSQANRFVDLNDSASELWTVMSRHNWSTVAAVDHLCARYGFAVAAAWDVIDALVENLIMHGALREVEMDRAQES